MLSNLKIRMNCPLCETLLINKVDDYYYLCPTCGAYVKDKSFYLNTKQEKDRYEEHNNDVNDLQYQNFTSRITNAVLEQFNTTHLGLDYGCGTGPVISKILKDKGYQILLYDYYFYQNNDYLNYQYDYIFSCEVFEHFYHPKQEIEKLLKLLKPKGVLLIMTHLYNSSIDFKNWYYRKDPTHVFIYTAKTILFIAKKYMLPIEKQNDRMIILKKRPTTSYKTNVRSST